MTVLAVVLFIALLVGGRSGRKSIRRHTFRVNSAPSRRYAGTKSFYDERGYLRFRDSGILLHRYFAEKKVGRRLEPWEVVHHVDGNKLNNHPANLEVYGSWAEHDAVHRRNVHVHGTWHKPRS